MACKKCNSLAGVPKKYPLWVMCGYCQGEGEIVSEKNGQELIKTCRHCQGTAVCTKEIKK